MSSVGACAAGLPRLLSGQLAVRLPDGAPHCTARRAEELAGLAEELAARDLEEALAELAAANDLDAEGAKELLGKAASGDAGALGRVQALVGSNANASGRGYFKLYKGSRKYFIVYKESRKYFIKEKVPIFGSYGFRNPTQP